MNVKSVKKMSFSLFSVSLIAVGAFFYFNHGISTTEHGINVDRNVVFDTSVSQKKINSNQSFNNVDHKMGDTTTSSEEIVWEATPEQIAELRKWKASRGWYDTSQANQDDYKSYSREVLKQLADSGDLNALHMLNRGAPIPEKKALLTKAIMYGSTFAIVIMTDVEMPEYHLMGQQPTDEEIKKDVINAAVYPVLAKMRGELDYTPESEFPKLEKEFAVQLSDADRKLIEEKAAKLYAELESQREQLGLGKFDNTIPPIAQAYYRSNGVLK